MKKLFLILPAFALVACSEENKDSVATQSDMAVRSEAVQSEAVRSEAVQSDMPSLESASDFGNMKLEQSPYDFSSMENLRASILVQAEKESLSLEEVSAGIDELAGKLITENFEKLADVTTEEEAEIAMMRLFMRAMGAKKLKVILELN